jgi:hypothetical protein
MDIIWALAMDPPGVPSAIAEQARNTFVELIQSVDFVPLKPAYIEKCILALKDGVAVPQALMILRPVLEGASGRVQNM